MRFPVSEPSQHSTRPSPHSTTGTTNVSEHSITIPSGSTQPKQPVAARLGKRPTTEPTTEPISDSHPCKRPRSHSREARQERLVKIELSNDAGRQHRAINASPNRDGRSDWATDRATDRATPGNRVVKIELSNNTDRVVTVQRPASSHADGWVLVFRQTTPRADRNAGGFFRVSFICTEFDFTQPAVIAERRMACE